MPHRRERALGCRLVLAPKLETPRKITVREIMTSPAVSIEEATDVKSLCELMWKLGIHRMPVLREGRVTGIVSSLDVCNAIARGEIKI